MFARISRGIELARQSWNVLREEKTLLVFPFLSAVACGLVMASFALPLWFSGYAQGLFDDGRLKQDPVAYAILFAFYFVTYFIVVFFNSALIRCAMIRFQGGDATLADGIGAAMNRLPQIAAWAFVSATVGLILKAIESRSEALGRFVTGLLGAGWAIATFFVVPVLVVEGVGPIQAVKRSCSILKRAWGESLVAQFGIGFCVFLATLLAIVPGVIGVALGTPLTAGIGIGISVLLVLIISLISAALHTIILAALYMYAAEGKVPSQFDEQLLASAYSPKAATV
jgi:hypothetical protein